MDSKPVSRGVGSIILVTVMAVCLVLAVVGEAIAVVWSGDQIGNAAGTAADASAWLFAALLFTAFALTLLRRKEKGRRNEAAEWNEYMR